MNEAELVVERAKPGAKAAKRAAEKQRATTHRKTSEAANHGEYVPFKHFKKKIRKEEALQELSKSTYISYANKALKSATNHRRGAINDPANKKEHKRIADKRVKGAGRAVKLYHRHYANNKEETEVNELSKGLLSRYVKQSATDRANAAHEIGTNPRPNLHYKKDPRSQRYFRRWKFHDKAVNRLAKEETVNELSDKLIKKYARKAAGKNELGLGKDRNKGLKLAAKKLATKKEEALQELSRRTMADYVGAAHRDVTARRMARTENNVAANTGNMPPWKARGRNEKITKKIDSRERGIRGALHKLAKEGLGESVLSRIQKIQAKSLGKEYSGRPFKDRRQPEQERDDKEQDDLTRWTRNAKRAKRLAAKEHKEETLSEKLAANASKETFIHDFVHSKNSRFKGDSKKQRINRALGAWYGKHNEALNTPVHDVSKGRFGSIHWGNAAKKTKVKIKPQEPTKVNADTTANKASSPGIGNEESIQELARKTLGSYIKKAVTNVRQRAREAVTKTLWTNKDYIQNDKDKKKTGMRLKGIHTAVDKLSREETLSELSAKVLRNYEKGVYKEFQGGKEKRRAGLNRAGDKIAGVAKVKATREETVNELSKALHARYQDAAKKDIEKSKSNARKAVERGSSKVWGWKKKAAKRGEGLLRSVAKTHGIKGIHAKVMAT